MGKGDKRTAKGKRKVGSYGNSRQKATQKAGPKTDAATKTAVVKKKVVEKKPAPKKK